MVPDHFVNNKAQELFGEIRIKLGITRELPKPLDLPFLARGVSRGQCRFRLKLANGLRYFETLGEHEDQCSVNVIDAVAKLGKGIGFGHVSHMCR